MRPAPSLILAAGLLLPPWPGEAVSPSEAAPAPAQADQQAKARQLLRELKDFSPESLAREKKAQEGYAAAFQELDASIGKLSRALAASGSGQEKSLAKFLSRPGSLTGPEKDRLEEALLDVSGGEAYRSFAAAPRYAAQAHADLKRLYAGEPKLGRLRSDLEAARRAVWQRLLSGDVPDKTEFLAGELGLEGVPSDSKAVKGTVAGRAGLWYKVGEYDTFKTLDGAELWPLDESSAVVIDKDGRRTGWVVDAADLFRADGMDRAGPAERMARSLLRAQGRGDEGKVLAVKQWLMDFSRRDGAVVALAFAADAEGRYHLVSATRDGTRYVETARFGESSSFAGHKAESLLVTMPVRVSAAGELLEYSPKRWREYLPGAETMREWSESAPQRDAGLARGGQEAVRLLLTEHYRQVEGGKLSWTPRGVEPKGAAARPMDEPIEKLVTGAGEGASESMPLALALGGPGRAGALPSSAGAPLRFFGRDAGLLQRVPGTYLSTGMDIPLIAASMTGGADRGDPAVYMEGGSRLLDNVGLLLSAVAAAAPRKGAAPAEKGPAGRPEAEPAREPGSASPAPRTSAVDRPAPGGPKGIPPGESPHDVLTNRMGGADVAARLGVAPGAPRGPLLSDPQKSSTELREVRTRRGRTFFEKVFRRPEEACDELFMRKVVKAFFGDVFDVPDAVGYLRGGPFSKEAVVLMERAPGGADLHRLSQLSLEQKEVLAVLRGTFGLQDLDSGAILFGGKKPALIDLALTGGAVRPGAPLLPAEMALAGRPWVSRFYLNELADYQPAIDRWRAQFRLPETQRALEGMMREAGMDSDRAAAELRDFNGNNVRLEDILRADIDAANAFFLKEAARVRLTPEQARMLSALNKAAHASPRDTGPRDALRALNARIAAECGVRVPSSPDREQSVLAPEELAYLLRRRAGGLGPADRAAVKAAGAGRGLETLERITGLGDRAAREAERVNNLEEALLPPRGWLLLASRKFGEEAPAGLRKDVARAVDVGQAAETLARQLIDRLRGGSADPAAAADMSRRLKGMSDELDALHRRIIGRFEDLARAESPDWKWKPSQLAENLRGSAARAEVFSCVLWGGAQAKGRGPAPARASVVSALAKTIPVLSGHGVRWTLDMRVGDGARLADPAALDRVLSDLVLDAAEAMEGSLARNLAVRARESPDLRRLRLEVSDTGPGMGPELLEAVRGGKPSTAKDPYKGGGEGLPAVRAAALGAGGTFEVESVLEKGATFKIELPLVPPKKR